MSVTLDTQTITTDAFAGMTVTDVTYTTASFSWTNPSNAATPVDFKIVETSGAIADSATISVGASATGTYTATGLTIGTQYTFALHRYEVDAWVEQIDSTSGFDYAIVNTHTSTLNITTGSSSATVSWNNPTSGTPVYSVTYRVGLGAAGNANINADGVSTTLSNLNDGTEYTVTLSVTESGQSHLLYTDTFTTSADAEMVITGGPFASYIELDWSASVDTSGSSYRVVNRVGETDDVLVEDQAVTSATIRDLIPGQSYVFVLQRLELDGSYEDQNFLNTTALTTTMSIGSIGSKTLEVSWGSLYTGATFQVLYNGEVTEETTGTTAVLKNLTPSTDYTLNLIVKELGESVGLSSLGMSTNTEASSTTSTMAMIMIAVIIAFLAYAKSARILMFA